MLKILILADDLTGAADACVAFAEHGLASAVRLADAESLPSGEFHGIDVLALDADTRCMPPSGAAATVDKILRSFVDSGPASAPSLIFKKIDSTLRGNVAEELAAALAVLREKGLAPPRPAIILAPAFPACGRTTVNGSQRVHGKALAESDAWLREPAAPPATIAAMLQKSGLSCGLLELARVRAPAAGLESSLQTLTRDADVTVCDAETEADLEAIVRAGLLLEGRILWAGSAALARQIARCIAPLPNLPAALALNVRGPALFVIGSPAQASRRQAGELAKSDIAALTLSLPGDSHQHERFISERLRLGDDVLLQVDADAHCASGQGRQVSQSLARVLAPCMPHAGALFITGGDTARAILDSLGIRTLRVLGELEPGLPCSVATLAGRELLILTKAGAFGTPDTLLRCREFIRSHTAVTLCTRERAEMQKPIIAITMGDAAGVGPEVIVKSLEHPDLYNQCRPLVIGDAERLRQAAGVCAVSLPIQSIPPEQIGVAGVQPGTIDCLDLHLIPSDLPWGKLSAVAGEGAYQFLAMAAQLAMQGKVDAICTAPLNKEALHAAGHKFPGHTELLAHLTGTPEVSMMLITPKLRVLHVTTHIGLIDAIAKIEPGLVERTIARGHAALAKSGIADPRIGVCGINPHAGESGLFGYGEEEDKIAPAIDACRRRGWNVEGPLPADTLFYRAQRGDFDLVIAMYHDQGHGPVKVLGIESGVNVTIGLPVVRTSVDHGTAFDIAGTGKADERSMIEAIRQAVLLAPQSPANR